MFRTLGSYHALMRVAEKILAPRHGFELALTPRENSRNDDIRLRWDSLPGNDLCSDADESSVHVRAATNQKQTRLLVLAARSRRPERHRSTLDAFHQA